LMVMAERLTPQGEGGSCEPQAKQGREVTVIKIMTATSGTNTDTITSNKRL